jgi:hypothetical protein
MFAVTRNQGFVITFDNECSISVQFGPDHYSAQAYSNYVTHTACSAEVLIKDQKKKAVFLPYDHPLYDKQDSSGILAYISSNDVAELIQFTSQLPSSVEIEKAKWVADFIIQNSLNPSNEAHIELAKRVYDLEERPQ